jgi:glycosyltransferase involved in cell wall biosynthesis
MFFPPRADSETFSRVSPDNSITVVVPCYTQEHYLFRAISSVLWQMLPDDELVIIHDTAQPLDHSVLRISDPRIVVLENGENKGVSHSRNRAIQQSKKQWIKFLDSDDVLSPFALDIVRGKVVIGEKTQVITAGAHRMFDGEYWDYVCADENTLRDFKLRNPTLPSFTFARRAALVEVGLFNERIDHEEDWDLWLRIHERYGVEAFQIVNQPICYYWAHEAERQTKRRTAQIDGRYVRQYLRERYGATPAGALDPEE